MALLCQRYCTLQLHPQCFDKLAKESLGAEKESAALLLRLLTTKAEVVSVPLTIILLIGRTMAASETNTGSEDQPRRTWIDANQKGERTSREGGRTYSILLSIDSSSLRLVSQDSYLSMLCYNMALEMSRQGKHKDAVAWLK